MNKIKVIKQLGSLEIGDILTWNEQNNRFELNKVNEDISKDSHSYNKSFIAIDKYVAEDNSNFFCYIDDEGNDVDIKTITWRDIPSKDKEDYIVELENKVKDLSDKLNNIQTIIK